jgi:hypothetical protein
VRIFTLLNAALTGFAVPLNEIRHTTSLFHEYPSSVVSLTPYTTSLLSAFILDRARVFRLFKPQQLTGYLGDFHPDIRQLCKRPLFMSQNSFFLLSALTALWAPDGTPSGTVSA